MTSVPGLRTDVSVLPLPFDLPAAWRVGHHFDKVGRVLADGHYSRRKPGSPQFMPPGQRLVLVTLDERAVFGWWRPDPSSGIKAMNGLDGWTCTIFRNLSSRRSSELIIDAERELLTSGLAATCGPDGLITYVWCSKVRSPNPGYCFQCAGWSKTGWSADRKKRLLQKPRESIGMTLLDLAAQARRRT